MATQASRNVPKPRRRKAEERRAEIVECAAGIAMAEGTSSVTMQRVAAELEKVREEVKLVGDVSVLRKCLRHSDDHMDRCAP